MKTSEIRKIVDAAIVRYNNQSRSYGITPPSQILEEEILAATGESKIVPLVEKPTISEMLRAAKSVLNPVGRPSEMSGGKKVNTYLDAESISIATRLGNGNVSEGIRKALKQAGE